MAEVPVYQCCTVLMPLSRATGLPIDQVNFLVCQVVALLFGLPFRRALGPNCTSVVQRHVIEVVVGLGLAAFCFGSQVIHLALQAYICFALMYTLPANHMGKVVTIFAMGYLCLCHINRLYYDYGGYTLDITGPLMVSTQRLTSLAYNIADGRVADESKLSKNCKSLAVRSFPSFLEFTSYVFSFHMILCGPFCFYKDYIAFIDGSNLVTAENSRPKDDSVVPGSTVGVTPATLPDPKSALLSYGGQCVLCAIMSVIIQPFFPCTFMTGEEFRQLGFLHKTLYMIISTSLMRWKYYFAWKLSEAVNASAGLGFNGYDNLGRPKWDLIDNADIYRIETSSSLKILLDNWNKMSSLWLRCIVYERVNNTFAVFMVSAFWHGFYAGYYITFISGGYFLHMGRLVRRYVRPFFQGSSQMRFLYDVITFTATRVGLAYMVFPFVLLEFWLSVEILKQMYFWMHIAGAVIILVLTISPPRVAREERPKQS